MNTESQLITSICTNKDISKAIESRVEERLVSHRDIFSWLKEYYFAHREVPSVGLVEEQFATFERSDVPGTTSYYIEKINETHLNTLIGKMIQGVANEHEKVPASDLLKKLMGAVNVVARESNVITDSMLNDVPEAIRELERRKDPNNSSLINNGISTGFKVMDTMYPTGLAPGHLAAIIGWSGHGKSLLAGLIALRAWEQGKRVLFVSLEMTSNEVRDRIFTVMGQGKYRHSNLSRGQVDLDDFEEWATGKVDGMKDFVVVTPSGASGMTPSMIQAKIEQYNADICFVDYVQLLDSDGGSRESETVKLKNISRDLKLMAQSNRIPIVMLTQATMSDIKDTEEPPMMEQVAWSKGLQNDSDLAIAVHKYNDTQIFDIIGRKNRHGELFAFQVDWDIDNGIIKERI